MILCFALRRNISKGKLDFFSNLSFETAGGGGEAAVESCLFSSGVKV